MSQHPINLLTSLVRKGDSVSLTFRAVDAGTQVVFQPSIKGADTVESDPALAQQIAALALPFVFTVPAGADVNDALSEALEQISQSRQGLVSAHAAYQAAVDDAAARARQATAEKGKTKAVTKKPSTTGGSDAASGDDADGGDADATQGGEPNAAAPVPAPAVAPVQPSVFDEE